MPVFRSGPLPASAVTYGLSAHVDANGNLGGEAAPGSVIEVQNLSVAPTTGQLVGDGIDVVTAGADGRFSVALGGVVPGDVVQVQVRDPSARVYAALQLRVDAARTRFDPRAACVDLSRLRIDLGSGGLSITARTRLPVSEPDAVLRFRNQRSGVYVDVVVDPRGLIGSVRLDGQVGDVFSVAVSDGGGNRDFAQIAGTLTAILPAASTPAPQLSDRFMTARSLRGPLIGPNGPAFGTQGRIGNCTVPAACSAIAAVDEDAIRQLIRRRDDGTFVVSFHPPGRPPVDIVVDDTVWHDNSGPRYGQGQPVQGGAVETWFPLVEKAYAAWVGGYEALGQGSSVGRVLSELLGRPFQEIWLPQPTVDLWPRLQRATAQGQSMAVGTWAQPSRYGGTGLYANHAYSVVGIEERKGQKVVLLRNPWGSGEPVGDGTDDGVFAMKLDDVVALFQVLNIA